MFIHYIENKQIQTWTSDRGKVILKFCTSILYEWRYNKTNLGDSKTLIVHTFGKKTSTLFDHVHLVANACNSHFDSAMFFAPSKFE